MATSADPLADLGLKPGCSEQDVTRAFRRLARQSHPDKGGSKEAFQRINAAYEALTKVGGLEKAARKANPEADAADAAKRAQSFSQAWAQARRDSEEAKAELAKERARSEPSRAAWEKAKGDAKAERAAHAEFHSTRSEHTRRRDEHRKRKRQQEEEEDRNPEEWKRLRKEEAELKAQQQALLAGRRAKWAAQHSAHISGASLGLDFLVSRLRRAMQVQQQQALQQQQMQQKQRQAAAKPKAPPLARCLQKKQYQGRSSRMCSEE